MSIDYAVTERFDDWFPTVRSQTIFLNSYLRSKDMAVQISKIE